MCVISRNQTKTMLFRCRRCLYPNTKPDLWFDENGVCSACLAFDKRKEIDWLAREQEFLSIVRANRGKTHDVIVACSGGKDSTAQVLKCLELGLRPLAVTATTDHLSELGRKNLDNISRLCDHVEVAPHADEWRWFRAIPPTRRKLARFALEEVGDVSWCEHHLIWSIPARESIEREIPIVLYGECPQNEYGAGPAGSEAQTQLTKSWVFEYGGLLGLRVSDVCEILGIPSEKLELYRYPDNAGNVKALFMGAYFPWDGHENAQIAKRHGFTTLGRDVEGSLYDYENLDNLQTGIHDRMRWLKFGYTRADDIASNHIRRGRLSRDDAVRLVSGKHNETAVSYLGVPLDKILAAIDMTRGRFEEICERFTDHEVVQWAQRPESYQCFSGINTVPLKESDSTQAVA
jgi:N-acetyl sugar amidotransferase